MIAVEISKFAKFAHKGTENPRFVDCWWKTNVLYIFNRQSDTFSDERSEPVMSQLFTGLRFKLQIADEVQSVKFWSQNKLI